MQPSPERALEGTLRVDQRGGGSLDSTLDGSGSVRSKRYPSATKIAQPINAWLIEEVVLLSAIFMYREKRMLCIRSDRSDEIGNCEPTYQSEKNRCANQVVQVSNIRNAPRNHAQKRFR